MNRKALEYRLEQYFKGYNFTQEEWDMAWACMHSDGSIDEVMLANMQSDYIELIDYRGLYE